MTLTVRVISPDKTVWDAPAEEVVLPSTTGQLGILTGHAPLLTALDTGVMRVRGAKNQNWEAIALLGGFAEVEENEVTILVNGAERGDKINLDEARTAYNASKSSLSRRSPSPNSGNSSLQTRPRSVSSGWRFGLILLSISTL
jgi:F-type H+-transporting ATPase subunit epsilon